MTSLPVPVPDAKALLTPVGETLVRIGITSLNLQARARLHEDQGGRALADTQSPIARASLETQSNLVAMARYCLHQLVPRIHSLMQQAEAVADAINSAAAQPAPDIGAELTLIAAELDRCGIILRGHARSSLRISGMIRMSEQRLWGGLAAELHRIEGTDGPIMRACARIETMAFDLANAAEEIMEAEDDLSLTRRHQLCMALIRSTWEAGSGVISDDELTRLIAPLGERLPEIRELIQNLASEHRALRGMSLHAARALSVATEASAQSVMTTRLEDMFRELDGQFSARSSSYRKLARKMGNAASRASAKAMIASDAQELHAAMLALSEPLTLSDGGTDPTIQLRSMPGRPRGLAAALRA